MSHTIVPHFKFPFHLAVGGAPQVVEQDTDGEIEDCIEVILSTGKQERIDLPEFGIEDQVFREGGVDFGYIQAEVSRWEPRADVDAGGSAFVDLVQSVQVRYRGRDIIG